MSVQRAAVVLLSGGLDSATVLAIAKSEGFRCHTLCFDYGQRHKIEIDAARTVSQALGAADHRVIGIDLTQVGGSALTDDIDVPKDRSDDDIADGIPVTYVPARNMLFLSCAIGLAEALNASDVFIGVNAIDYSGYPDCRPEFITAFEEAAMLGTKRGADGIPVRIRTPLISLTKAQIIDKGVQLGVDYAMTISCYDPQPDGAACGTCDACTLRRNGFEASRTQDPTRYAPAQPSQ